MIETFDQEGRQTLGFDSRVAKFMGVATVGWDTTGAAQSGTIVDDRFTQYPGTIPYATVIDGTIDIGGYMPSISISGNTLTWQYNRAEGTQVTRRLCSFIYGIW